VESIFCPDAIIWGDVGTWVAGLGTLITAIVAVGLATASDRRIANNRDFAAHLYAITAVDEVGRLRAALAVLRREMLAIDGDNAARLNWERIAGMIRALDAPYVLGSDDKFVLFKGDDARFLASMRSNLIQLRSAINPWGRTDREMAAEAGQYMEPTLALAGQLQRYTNGAFERLWSVGGKPMPPPADPDTHLTTRENELAAAYDRRAGGG
jgi:hypothetical protein